MTPVIADARRFAEMHALYRMYDERGRVLYIGITGDLGKRLGDHAVKRWFPLVEQIKLEWLPTRAAALLAERRAISAEHPRYNHAGLTPLKEVKKPRPVRRKPKAELTSEPRDLVADLGAVMKGERLRVRDVVALLRGLAPSHAPYQKMTGVQLVAELRRKNIRTVNASGVHYLCPEDLQKALRKIAA